MLQLFFLTFGDLGIKRKLIFFLIIHGEFYSVKMYRLEDINENVTSYGYPIHNKV